jgi:hypothetical protein
MHSACAHAAISSAPLYPVIGQVVDAAGIAR